MLSRLTHGQQCMYKCVTVSHTSSSLVPLKHGNLSCRGPPRCQEGQWAKQAPETVPSYSYAHDGLFEQGITMLESIFSLLIFWFWLVDTLHHYTVIYFRTQQILIATNSTVCLQVSSNHTERSLIGSAKISLKALHCQSTTNKANEQNISQDFWSRFRCYNGTKNGWQPIFWVTDHTPKHLVIRAVEFLMVCPFVGSHCDQACQETAPQLPAQNIRTYIVHMSQLGALIYHQQAKAVITGRSHCCQYQAKCLPTFSSHAFSHYWINAGDLNSQASPLDGLPLMPS